MYFITSSGTGIGKTFLTAALAYQLRISGKTVNALKPVISGFTEDDLQSDTAQLLLAQNLEVNRRNVEAISPWRFAAAYAANVAARLEGREIDYDDLLKFCRLPRIADYSFIEGAGGVMSPLTDHKTMLDWMVDINAKIILVAGSYLGAISHALTACEVIKAKGLHLQAVIVSENVQSSLAVCDVAGEIKRFMRDSCCVVPLPFVAGGASAWKNAADLTWLLDNV